MPLPKATPPRRFHLPPPAPRRSGAPTGQRLRTMVRRHEEEEKPFDPERAPRWKGSSTDLVVNASGFQKDLRELVEQYHPKLNTELSVDEMTKEIADAFRKQKTDDALERANELLEGFGIESVGGVNHRTGPRYLYINFGDTYAPTIAWSRDDNKVFVAMGGWGDLAEANEASAFDEGWEERLASEFTYVLESAAISADPDHDTDDPVPGGVQEKALALIDSPTGELKELFQRALSRAQGVGGKYPEVSEESDGSIFISDSDLGAVAREAVAMLAEGWEPGKWEGHSKPARNGHRPNGQRFTLSYQPERGAAWVTGESDVFDTRDAADVALADQVAEAADPRSQTFGYKWAIVPYGEHRPNVRAKPRRRVGADTYVPHVPRPKFRVGQRVSDLDGARPGEIAIVGNYDEVIGGYRYKVQEDSGSRIYHNETNMKLIPRR